MGTSAPLGGFESEGYSQMMLSAFREAGSHLAIGHSEAKLLFYININEACRQLLCPASPCLPWSEVLRPVCYQNTIRYQHTGMMSGASQPLRN